MFIDHRYEVLESLGSGSWANVYKVRDVRSDSIYTLKLFQYLSSEELYKHFKPRDMHHITKIEHPNLNHVVDFGHVGDHIYFISEFFDGVGLNNFRFSKSRVNQLYSIIVQICYALNALHTQNIMHKDLKPENILYKAHGNTLDVKLIDYGFSRLELDKDTQYVSGTLPYIAPEIYLGKPVGFSSDFYSLGVLIYRLTTGSFPFTLEQINALRSGSQQYFIPIFPSELNPNIPLQLEKLCLRLLERNPDNRFQSSEEIINYINRTSGREYQFSVSWSLVNSMQFNSYTVRENIAAEILDYLPQVESGNGKIISVVGGEGLGKDSILSLFRYHILRGSYFIFDYNCTRTEHEAFFALIKEYLQSLTPEEIEHDHSLNKISEKMRRYLFMSEQAAKGLTQTQEDLRADFEFAKALLIELSVRKPVIFIVRNIQHVHRYTIDFINFISEAVVKHRIMVLMSCTEFNKVSQIDHTILINIPMFEPGETLSYIRKLMNTEVPEDFCLLVHKRSSGNPYFVREILIDLTLRKKIVFDTEFSYPANLDEYTLPSRLVHSIYSRMSHLTASSYKQLQKLAVVQTPISRDLIRYICKVPDNELYSLLNEGKYNEILEKSGNHYHFTFPEAKDRFFLECSAKQQKLVSLRVIKYYQGKKLTDQQTCKGIISNARIAGDALIERSYLLLLVELLLEDYSQEKAYAALAEALNIDFRPDLNISLEEKTKDLLLFHQLTETTGSFATAELIWNNQREIPENFAKHLLLGTLKLLSEDLKNALKHFLKAETLASNTEDKVSAILYQARIHSYSSLPKMKICLDKVAAEELPLALRIGYINLLALYHFRNKDHDPAIRTVEEFISQLPPNQDSEIMIRLASLHNELGEFYSVQKNVTEADEHFGIALSIWKRYNIRRHLGWIHNNISDLYLKQGFTVLAEKHSEQALRYSLAKEQILSQARALLNQGEGKIKMGEFEEAEHKLLEARDLILQIDAKSYLDSVKRNLALAKSKIIGFGHYYKFITDNEPKLIEGSVPEINPLVKTYFYYLSEMHNPKKLRRLIRKNAQIDFALSHEQEFYHNVLSLLAISEKDFETALKELKLAMQFAGEINNHYAMAVFNVLQVVCHYGLQDYARAR
ncbi:MAG: protein kinase, partial [Candidatus Syntrophosphaera sp.]|nr:protein kinase [Candidatus Syntrophosphaera sp.]